MDGIQTGLDKDRLEEIKLQEGQKGEINEGQAKAKEKENAGTLTRQRWEGSETEVGRFEVQCRQKYSRVFWKKFLICNSSIKKKKKRLRRSINVFSSLFCM